MATHQEGCHQVCITRTETVRPRPHHPPATHPGGLLKLSNLDRQCPVLMYLVFFYRTPVAAAAQHPPRASSLFSTLKTGLEEALAAWYPAAGRLFLNPATRKVDLVCNDAGALLVEAYTGMELSQLGDLSQHKSFYEQLVFRPPFSRDISEVPLVVAQVTRFGCGGYAVGVGTSHSLFDGWANFNFLSAWASRVTGVADERVELVRPVHEREGFLLEQEEPQRDQEPTGVSGDNKAAGVVLAFDHIYQLITQAASVHGKDLGGCKYAEILMSFTGEQEYVLLTYRVTPGMIEKLKREAMNSSGSIGISCSSFEVLAAHLWQARTKALGIGKDRMVCLQFAVDSRQKLAAPPLPRGFTGNAYVMSSAASTGGELAAQPLSSVVDKIKAAKRAVTGGYVRAYVAALEAPQSALPPLPELTMVSDWTRTPYHEVDFGLGPAAFAAPLGTPLPQVAYFMRSPAEEGGVDVRIGLLPGHVEAFSGCFFAGL